MQAGPERRVFTTSAKGAWHWHSAGSRGLTNQRERPPFLTWLALSWQAARGVFDQQVARRREFLEKELAREVETLQKD